MSYLLSLLAMHLAIGENMETCSGASPGGCSATSGVSLMQRKSLVQQEAVIVSAEDDQASDAEWKNAQALSGENENDPDDSNDPDSEADCSTFTEQTGCTAKGCSWTNAFDGEEIEDGSHKEVDGYVCADDDEVKEEEYDSARNVTQADDEGTATSVIQESGQDQSEVTNTETRWCRRRRRRRRGWSCPWARRRRAPRVIAKYAGSLKGNVATQSSTSNGGVASRAIDGNGDGFWSSRSCTHTDESKSSPWWQVDLGSPKKMSAIRITNRQDCCSDRLSPFTVSVDGKPCAKDVAIKGETKIVPCQSTGQVIRVQVSKTNNPFTICEFEAIDAATDQYISTFNAIGCPNTVLDVEWWKKQTNAVALNDMFQYCTLMASGKASATQKTACCGNGNACSVTCRKLDKLEATPAPTPAPTPVPLADLADVSWLDKTADNMVFLKFKGLFSGQKTCGDKCCANNAGFATQTWTAAQIVKGLHSGSDQVVIDVSNTRFSTAGGCNKFGNGWTCNGRGEGQFSFDLGGTPFSIPGGRSAWVTNGWRPQTSIQCSSGDQLCQGKCGGHCGGCHLKNIYTKEGKNYFVLSVKDRSMFNSVFTPPATTPPATTPPATTPPVTPPPATLPGATLPPATAPRATMPPASASIFDRIDVDDDNTIDRIEWKQAIDKEKKALDDGKKPSATTPPSAKPAPAPPPSSNPAPAPAPPSSSTLPTKAQQDAIVQKHNELRAKMGASDMTKMGWDDALATAAQQFVAGCPSGHSENRPSAVGENMAWKWATGMKLTASTDFAPSVQSWYDEFDAAGPYKDGGTFSGFGSCSGMCGHYTQVVWAAANKIGCGAAYCPHSSGMGGYELVCQYGSSVPGGYGGNMGSQTLFTKGTQCSSCPSGFATCSDGLCSASG
jgi:hypothetical protein